MIAQYTRERLALEAERAFKANQVIEVLGDGPSWTLFSDRPLTAKPQSECRNLSGSQVYLQPLEIVGKDQIGNLTSKSLEGVVP